MTKTIGDQDGGGSNLRKLEGVKILIFWGPLKSTPFYGDSLKKILAHLAGQKSKSPRGNFGASSLPWRSVRFDPPYPNLRNNARNYQVTTY